MPQISEFKLNPLDGSVTTEYSDGTVKTGSLLPASGLSDTEVTALQALAVGGGSKIASLMRAAFANPNPNRVVSTAWAVADAHSVSTAYINSQYVSNAGNLYLCITGGTSGSASAPTGTGFAFITDGAVTWQYAGPAPSGVSGGPALSQSTTAPVSPSRFYRNATGTFSSGATTVVSNDNWFRHTHYAGTTNITGIGPGGNTWGGVAFDTDSKTITLVRQGALGYGIMVAVDGRSVKPGIIADTASSTQYITLTFTGAKRRRVEVTWDMVTSCTLKGVYVDSTASCYAPQGVEFGYKVAALGDSFTAGGGGYYSACADLGIYRRAWAQLGCASVQMDGQGGTGFTAGGASNVYGSTSRIAKLVAFAPDIVHVHGSVNDAANIASLPAVIVSYISAVRAALGQSVLIIISGDVGKGNTTQVETALEAAIRQGVTNSADSKVFFLPASGAQGGPWVQGTGNVTSQTGVGNADMIFGADGLHPVQRGHEYIADRNAQALISLMNSL